MKSLINFVNVFGVALVIWVPREVGQCNEKQKPVR